MPFEGGDHSIVDLSGLLLQLFVWYLYKAEPLPCGYSTLKGDNLVEMPNKRCHLDSFKSDLLFVVALAYRITIHCSLRRD
jgi:hypothetical protein|tara:strand:+ start:504 stop:743 length:240 start_codon:yes stop_codon:yes gene_type:complete